jgi:hypothetical protein
MYYRKGFPCVREPFVALYSSSTKHPQNRSSQVWIIPIKKLPFLQHFNPKKAIFAHLEKSGVLHPVIETKYSTRNHTWKKTCHLSKRTITTALSR